MSYADIVDVGSLRTIAAAVAAGVGITVAFSLAVLGTVRGSVMLRDERYLPASLYGTLGAVGFLLSIAGIVVGLIVMTNK